MRNIRKAPWSRRAVLRYVLLQIPGAALLCALLIYFKGWLGLGWVMMGGILFLWVAKDVILFPFVWKAYEPRPGQGDSLIGETAVAQDSLSPSGYVRVRGELWRARLAEPSASVEKGESVLVSGREGLTLSVEKID
jgi:membrane protein implicated in regulation of membrane protease activity